MNGKALRFGLSRSNKVIQTRDLPAGLLRKRHDLNEILDTFTGAIIDLNGTGDEGSLVENAAEGGEAGA